MGGYVLVESRLYAGKERVHGLLSLGVDCLVGDVQQVQTTGSSKSSALMASTRFFCSSLWAASHSSQGLYHLFYVLVGGPLCIRLTRKVGGGVCMPSI